MEEKKLLLSGHRHGVCSSAPPRCVYTLSGTSVEANLICCRGRAKNSHDVMTGLSHWLRGVSLGGAPALR